MSFESWFDDWPFLLQITFFLTPFAIGVVGKLITLFMVRHDLETLLSVFPKSIYMKRHTIIWKGSGFLSRYMQLNTICGAILMPRYYLSRGELEHEELLNVPQNIKFRALLSSWLLGISLTWIITGSLLFS